MLTTYTNKLFSVHWNFHLSLPLSIRSWIGKYSVDYDNECHMWLLAHDKVPILYRSVTPQIRVRIYDFSRLAHARIPGWVSESDR